MLCLRRPSGVALAVSLAAVLLSGARADEALDALIDEAFEFAGKQLTVLTEDVLVTSDMFTDYTDEEGKWRTLDSDGTTEDNSVWTSGMVCGLFWYQFAYTGDEIWKERAIFHTSGMAGTEVADDNDVGFQVFNSYGLGYKLTGDSSYKDYVLTGAETLYNIRYDDKIPAFWSWANPSRRPDWERAVNVDMMMNLEIMLWAAENGGDSEAYTEAARGHADLTWRDIVRDDNSTFHVADYDPDTGELVDQGTYQGATDDSTWSRGQAWAIYGYIMVYRFLSDEKYLDYCIGLLEYFMDENDDDNIPYADFDAAEDGDNPKDSSSTAIVSSALLEIFHVTGEAKYLETAETYLKSVLSPDYFLPDADDGWQSILRRASAEHGDPELGAIFGDYFLLEAMLRYKTMSPDVLLTNEPLEVGGSGESRGGGSRRKLQRLEGGNSCSLETQNNAVAVHCVSNKSEEPPTASGGSSRGRGDVELVLDLYGSSSFTSTHDVMVWFGVTLANLDVVPTSLEIESEGAILIEEVTGPLGGWKIGTNTVSVRFRQGSIGRSSEDMKVVVKFSPTDKAGADATNAVTINHLVFGNSLGM